MPAVWLVWFVDVEKVQRMTAGGMAWRFVEHGDGRAVRSGRRAAMVVEPWPLVAGAACRQDHEQVKCKLLPVVVAVGSIAR